MTTITVSLLDELAIQVKEMGLESSRSYPAGLEGLVNPAASNDRRLSNRMTPMEILLDIKRQGDIIAVYTD